MDKQDKQFIALETAINDEFIMLRKFDQYFPIYLVAKDNHSEVFVFECGLFERRVGFGKCYRSNE